MSFNPHPPLTGFPIVLATLIVGSEILAYIFKNQSIKIRKAGKLFVLLSCFLAPITYYSGYWGAELASQSFKVSDEIISEHQMFAKVYLATLVVSGLFVALSFEIEKKKSVSKLFRISYSIVMLLTFVAALLVSRQGGLLVFEHGAGVYAR